MDAPTVRYVTTSDGVSIAYWAIGSGPPLVELPALPHGHIGMEWEQPEWRFGYELAATERTLVRYDARGVGLSQREVTDFSFEAQLKDLVAVLETVGPGPVALSGITSSCALAVTYAARHPERVSHVLLWIPVIDGSVLRANPMLSAARKVAETEWEMFSETVAHALLGWDQPEAARKYAALIRAGNSPDTLLTLVDAMHRFNSWDDLPRVQCPVLVMHRPALGILPPGHAERVAARIPNAELALFEGTASAPFVGDWRSIVRAQMRFLGMQGARASVERGGRALRLLSMKSNDLTRRETEVVNLVVQGMTNKEIAEELYLAEKTVENHIGRVLVKLDLRSRTQLAAWAVEHGLGGKTA